MARRPIRAEALAALGVGLLSLEAAAIIGVAPRVGAVLESERGSALAHATVVAARTIAEATSHQALDMAGGLAIEAVRHAADAYTLMLRVTPRASAHAVEALDSGAVPCSHAAGSCRSACGAPAIVVPAAPLDEAIERGAS